MSKPIIIIPARLKATRLPDKPLADILGKPMIVWVMERALAANLGPVVIACAEAEIKNAVEKAGGRAVLTDPDHPSGSDRIFEALNKVDPNGEYDTVINVQGDLPTIDPAIIKAALKPLIDNPATDIATLIAEIKLEEEKTNPKVVKAIVGLQPGQLIAPALYFTRATAPTGDGPLYHHIGLYAYRRAALARFIELPQGVLEKRERLEQLRALENGMRIDAHLVDTVPLGVDTMDDLNRARAMLER